MAEDFGLESGAPEHLDPQAEILLARGLAAAVRSIRKRRVPDHRRVCLKDRHRNAADAQRPAVRSGFNILQPVFNPL